MCQGFGHYSGFLHHFVKAKLVTSSIRVNSGWHQASLGNRDGVSDAPSSPLSPPSCLAISDLFRRVCHNVLYSIAISDLFRSVCLNVPYCLAISNQEIAHACYWLLGLLSQGSCWAPTQQPAEAVYWESGLTPFIPVPQERWKKESRVGATL